MTDSDQAAAAVQAVPPSVVRLLRSLSALTPAQLALALMQKPNISALATSALHQTALYRISQPIPSASTELADIVDALLAILTALIDRGDPSLARKLLPTSGWLIDLAIIAAPLQPASATDVLERLLDVHSTAELLAGIEKELSQLLARPNAAPIGSAGASSQCAAIRSAARILAAFLGVCAPRLLTEAQTSLVSLAKLLERAYDEVLPALAGAEGGITAATLDGATLDNGSWQLHWLTAKVDVLQATHRLLLACFDRTSPLTAVNQLQSRILAALAGTTHNVAAIPPSAGALISAHLAEDLAGSFAVTSIVSTPTVQDAKSRAVVKRLQQAEQASTARFTGAGWTALHAVVRRQAKAKGKSRDTGGHSAPSRDGFSPDETLLVTVNSILPHLEIDHLRVVLSRPSFRGQSAEEVIQRLLEGDEEEVGGDSPLPQVTATAPRPRSPIYVPPEPTATSTRKPVRARANVFDDVPLDLSKASWHQAKGRGAVADVGTLSSDLKAAILARAEANSDDEDEEEWNPFAEVAPGGARGKGQMRTVGVEDELDLDDEGREVSRSARRGGGGSDDDDEEDEDEPEGLQRRMGTVNLSGSRPSALEYERYDAKASAPSPTPAPAPVGAAEVQRATERLLIRHYAQHGPSAFGKDAATRRSAQRRDLRAQLDEASASEGRRWDDALVESWASMFERNPRRDRLLASAGEVALSSSTRRAASPVDDGEDEGTKRFGPDRGRGGRILGGGRGGRGGRGGGGGGGGGGSTGAPRGGGSTRGRGTGHSGTDRSAKMKEKRGNQARQRGFDKKVARGAAGAAAD